NPGCPESNARRVSVLEMDVRGRPGIHAGYSDVDHVRDGRRGDHSRPDCSIEGEWLTPGQEARWKRAPPTLLRRSPGLKAGPSAEFPHRSAHTQLMHLCLSLVGVVVLGESRVASRPAQGSIDVRDYGAAGDGHTLDTSTIQRA